jgi:hypothetical protein
MVRLKSGGKGIKKIREMCKDDLCRVKIQIIIPIEVGLYTHCFAGAGLRHILFICI